MNPEEEQLLILSKKVDALSDDFEELRYSVSKKTGPDSNSIVSRDISIGGGDTLYQINNSGIFSFGDGSDGALSTSGNVTLTADKYYTDLTINDSHTFNPAIYTTFFTGT